MKDLGLPSLTPSSEADSPASSTTADGDRDVVTHTDNSNHIIDIGGPGDPDRDAPVMSRGGTGHAHRLPSGGDEHLSNPRKFSRQEKYTTSESSDADRSFRSSGRITCDQANGPRHIRFPRDGQVDPGVTRPRLRQRSTSWRDRRMADEDGSVFVLEAEHSNQFNLIEAAENEVEARKIFNNYQVNCTVIFSVRIIEIEPVELSV